MRELQEKFANGTPLQTAKREIHAYFRTRAVWAGTLCTGIILAVIAPFGTEQVLTLPARLPYWVTQAVVAFFLGSFGVFWGSALTQQRGWPLWAGIAFGSVIATVLVWGQVIAIDLIVFGAHRDWSALAELAVTILAICAVISTTFAVVDGSDADTKPEPPRLLNRLAPENRGALVSLSVSDHYVEVTTTKGAEMLLMRLSDAMRETGIDEGLQIHRSHWISRSYLQKIKRLDGKPHAILADGRALPVSRTYLPALKQAGF